MNELNSDDKLITVDLFDNEIGNETKIDVHKQNKLHRAFSVFLIRDDKMLIQKRAYNKYHSGGLWTNACCSHPRMGETLNDAVKRRLSEELGVSCNVREIGDFIYFADYNELSEYEYDHVFVGECSDDAIPDPHEIADIKWININELNKLLLSRPKDFTKWFLIAYPMVLRYLKNNGILQS